MNAWCEHCVWINDEKYIQKGFPTTDGWSRAICYDEIYCSICGAKRPEQPQSFRDELANKIRNIYLDDTAKIINWDKHDRILDSWCNQLADLAIEAVVKKAEEVKKTYGMPELNHINTLIRELKP